MNVEDHALRRAASVVAGLACALIAGALAACLFVGDPATATSVPFEAAFPAVGLVITRRLPRNAVAWCFLLASVLLGVQGIAQELAPYGLAQGWPDPVNRITGWLQTWLWLPGLFLIVTVGLLRFPDGALPGRRWRWVERASLAAMAVWSVALGEVAAVVPVAALTSASGLRASGVTSAFLLAGELMFVIVAGCALACVASLAVRYRRGTRTERDQLRWVLFAACVAIAIQAADVAAPLSSTVQSVGEGVGFALVAVATGVAITRYKLYEIERIVSRTVTYLIVIAVLAGLYLGVVVGVADLLPSGVGQLGVAAATLLVSVLAVPVTRQIRGAVDRRFNRARFDAEWVVAAFAARLRARPDRDDIPADLIDVVHRTVAPAHAHVWLLDVGATRR